MSKYEKFGKYILLEKLAAGGMAEVYLAKSAGASGVNKFVAIKRILPQFSGNEEFIQMFQDEAKVSVNLNHSNVVSIYDFGVEHGQFYIVLEFVEGRNLRQIINELKKNNKSLKIEEAVYIIKEAAAGLDHAHRCTDQKTGRPLNITHRDMSPQNIMVSFEGEPKVIDFGIAKQSDAEKEETRAGTLKGKFAYMSPEQAESEEVDPRTDVFALGIILWELLANDRLFTGSNENAILRKVRECQIPSIRKINPLVPVELERIVMKALSKEKNNRYQTAANLQKELNRFLNTQYPDFSTQDLSKTIIDCFKAAFTEGREKLVAYSKVDIEVNFSDSKKLPEVPMTSHEMKQNNKPAASGELPPVPHNQQPASAQEQPNNDLESRIVQPSAHKVELEGLKDAMTNFNVKKNNIAHKPRAEGTAITRASQVKPFIYQEQKNNNSFNVIAKLLVLVVIISGGYFAYNKYVANKLAQFAQLQAARIKNNQPARPIEAEQGQVDLAAKASVKVSFNTEPSGARIIINGNDSLRTTPAIIALPANVETFVKIQYTEEYNDLDLKKVFKDGESLTFQLQKLPKSGYLTVNVQNGGANPQLFINGQEIPPPFQGKRLKVRPDTIITVMAINPITQLKDETQVSIPADQDKTIELVLGRKN